MASRACLALGRIKSFAAEFDPQPFHLDEEARETRSFVDWRQSGRHIAAATMRLLVESETNPAGVSSVPALTNSVATATTALVTNCAWRAKCRTSGPPSRVLNRE